MEPDDAGEDQDVPRPRPGYLYVLVHPSSRDLYKIGVTVRHPERRVAEHNQNDETYAGRIVKETGQEWEIQTYIAVPDPYWAETVFWGNTPEGALPFRAGVEVAKMEWASVQAGLSAAGKAGIRPAPPRPSGDEDSYEARVTRRLEGRDIQLLSEVRSIVSGRADFRCGNGHTWRTRPILVCEGQGCPQCGLGEDDHDAIRERIGAGAVFLLTHRENPEYVQIGLSHKTVRSLWRDWPWPEWDDHRYRNVESLAVAEAEMWEFLGRPLPHDREPVRMDLDLALEAFGMLSGRYRRPDRATEQD